MGTDAITLLHIVFCGHIDPSSVKRLVSSAEMERKSPPKCLILLVSESTVGTDHMILLNFFDHTSRSLLLFI